MNNNAFEEWLVKNDGKTSGTAYNYCSAIPNISKHYLKETNHDLDFYKIDISELERISELYNQSGVYAEFGEKSKGTYRNALVALVKYRIYLNSESIHPNNQYSLKTDFLQAWSEERVKNMTLEEYTNLDKNDSFCYWLEIKTIGLGSISGGSSYKFGIFKRGENGEASNSRGRQSDGEYSWYSKYGESKQEAFKNVKDYVLKVINYSKNNHLGYIDKIDLGDAYKWKIAFLYSDYNVINIFKYDALKFLAIENSFELEVNQPTSKYQNFLLDLKQTDEDYFQFTQNLWNRFEASQKTVKPATLEQKRLFIQYPKNNNLSVEIADELEALSIDVISKGYFSKSIYECLTYYDVCQLQFEEPISNSKDDLYVYRDFIVQQIKSLTGVDLTIGHGLVSYKDELEYQDFISNNYWDGTNKNSYQHYVMGFNKGYKVALYTFTGHKQILVNAIGTVLANSEDGDVLNVNWDDSFDSFPVDLNSNFGSLDFYEIEPHSNEGVVDDIKNIFYKVKLMDTTEQPLNQILYGPPGTGKTYKIISNYISSQDTRTEKIDESKIYVNEKKNFWHLAPGESGYLWGELKTQNYLGYEWCDIGLGNLKDLRKENINNFDMKFRFSKVKEGDYFCIISGKKFYGIAKALHGYDFDKSKESDFDFQTVNVEWIKQFDKPELLNTYSTQSFSGTKGGKRWKSIIESLENQDIYFSSKKGEQVKKLVNNHAMVSFHQSFSYEDFIEGIKPDLESSSEDEKNTNLTYLIQDGIFKTACDKAANIAGYDDLASCLEDTKENRKNVFLNASPFYLLIDEINRGNVSSIFGELITLLEDDKRLGSKNELLVDLPYSKKPFGIPQNLHVIGTMNTADRSVEALDTALRRRFSFIEVYPSSEALKKAHNNNGIIESINLVELLDTINDRIELLIDKDHKIGHSYFINVSNLNDLIQTFKDKVIPLLEEYFYGDFGKIGLVLGKAFIEVAKKENKAQFANFDHEDTDILNEKKLYNFTDSSTWKTESFQSIYDTSIILNE